MAFTLLLSFLVALQSFGIDMSLPALTAMGAALHVAPAQAGLMMKGESGLSRPKLFELAA
jgi:DHA1 family bicyclomycin/chloramphenicol resistance-like MFS transporter